MNLFDFIFYSIQKHQLCQSVEEDDIKNTLLKFGSVLHLYDDATMFKKSIKSLVTNKKNKKAENKKLIEQSKKQIKAQARKDKDVRKKVKLNQGNFVGRSFPFSPPLVISLAILESQNVCTCTMYLFRNYFSMNKDRTS